jgi:hypothetical protein
VSSQSVTLYAVNASTGVPVTGDAANQLFYVSKDDGTVTAIASNSGVPTEVDSTNAKGLYKISLAQAETNAHKLLFTGKSSTANVILIPTVIYTTPNNFDALVLDSSGNITGNLVGTVSTLTTYTGNTPQTGDAYAYLTTNLGATGSNLVHVSANTTQFAGQTITCAAGVTILANVGFAGAPGAANGGLIAGSNAATTCASLTVTGAFLVSGGTTYTNANGDGFYCGSTGGNGNGVHYSGNGAGSGERADGGITGHGLYIRPGSSSGDAIHCSAGGGTDFYASSTTLILAKTTNITGFNDIAATAIVSSGAITTSGGKVSEVALVDTLTTYTGNTVQTGDSYARLGAPAGASIAADLAEIEAETDNIGTPQQAGSPVTLPANPPAGFLITASYGTAPAWFSSGGAPTLSQISAQIISDHGAGSYVNVSGGSGAYPVTVVVTSDGTTPIVGASVRISGAQAAFLTTNNSGQALFSLNAGGVTLSISAPGYYYNATAQTINSSGNWVTSGGATLTVTMTPNPTVTPSPNPNLTNLYFTCRNSIGTALPNVEFIFTLLDPIANTDAWNNGSQVTAISQANGLVTALLPIATTWRLQAPGGPNVKFTTGTGTTTPLPVEYVWGMPVMP